MDLKNKIERLKQETKADSILVITSGGNLVESAGIIDKYQTSTMYALFAGIFMAAKEVILNIEQKNEIKVSYLESLLYNIYISSITDDYLLIIIFKDKTNKGIVWYFGQQIIDELKSLLLDLNTPIIPKDKVQTIFSKSIDVELDSSLNSLWGLKPKKTEIKEVEILKEETQEKPNDEPIITYDEAVRKGIFKDKEL